MITKYCITDNNSIDETIIKEAGEIIKKGGLVAFPTETVYGLGGDGLNPESSKKIYAAKGRPSDNPLIIHIADINDLQRITARVPQVAMLLADKYWPGPLTMIFEKADCVPYETTGGLETVAVRFPSHPVAKAFIKAAGGFVAAPSANLSGRPSPTHGEHVRQDMDGRIEMIIDAGPCEIGLESTIIDCTGEYPMLLRPGYVSYDMLAKEMERLDKDPAVFGGDTSTVPKAPGMKYRHYAPKGQLTIVSGTEEKVCEYIVKQIKDKPEGLRIGVISCSDSIQNYSSADYVADIGQRGDEMTIASRLFDILRSFDEENIDIIFSEEFDTPQMGMAIMNRLIKAAGHQIVRVE